MAPRVFWKGYLKLSLVTCPVTMMPATSDSGKVRFHTLNARTGHRIVSRFVDEVSGKTVEDDDQAKGYPKSEDEHVLIEDEELDAVALESTRTIDIEMFVPSASIAWIWYDKPHFLSPSDKIGEEAFSVIRDAMAATGKVGIARLVLYRRERAVMLEPHGKGIVLWTLRYGDEVRDADDYFNESGKIKPDAALMKLVGNLIEHQIVDWDDSLVQDPVQENLLELIAAKEKSPKKSRRSAAPAAEQPGNVINIIDALKKSIAAERKGK
ncbi:Ku protein [Paracoccus aestuariivivens]|uniref:Non-homologous end joining protein Ku n=1 Tax=Paracoccus aestuariivivens TaxID=1820333 RepID=A0A6L6JCW5_9RHOB|nr:Ku protein [Paracoccus aestuariivivens]MTH79942.1 Ku protein [Paracoccus aestuariivivens]